MDLGSTDTKKSNQPSLIANAITYHQPNTPMKDHLNNLLMWLAFASTSIAAGAIVAKAICDLLHY